MKNILLNIAVLLLGVFAFFDALAIQKDSNEFLILTDTVTIKNKSVRSRNGEDLIAIIF
jgi:hypothetical protein